MKPLTPRNLWNHETIDTTKPMKPRNHWHHETYETMKPLTPRNLWNYETTDTTKPMKLWSHWHHETYETMKPLTPRNLGNHETLDTTNYRCSSTGSFLYSFRMSRFTLSPMAMLDYYTLTFISSCQIHEPSRQTSVSAVVETEIIFWTTQYINHIDVQIIYLWQVPDESSFFSTPL